MSNRGERLKIQSKRSREGSELEVKASIHLPEQFYEDGSNHVIVAAGKGYGAAFKFFVRTICRLDANVCVVVMTTERIPGLWWNVLKSGKYGDRIHYLCARATKAVDLERAGIRYARAFFMLPDLPTSKPETEEDHIMFDTNKFK